MNLLKKYKIYIIGTVIGAVAGFLYYSEIGCLTGTCAITSNPWLSSIYGGVMGYLLAGMVADRRKPTFSDDQ